MGLNLLSSFQHLAKYMLEIFVIKYTSILQYLGFKRNKQKCNLHYVAMHMMTSQILKFVDFTKTQKSRYLENETFLEIKKSLITH